MNIDKLKNVLFSIKVKFKNISFDGYILTDKKDGVSQNQMPKKFGKRFAKSNLPKTAKPPNEPRCTEISDSILEGILIKLHYNLNSNSSLKTEDTTG